jgi:glycosyltransferase involved in cell wall biosynthesis
MAWHLVTCEYPPQPGGVSDYTEIVANGLAAAGDEVHVWCPQLRGNPEPRRKQTNVFVHRELGRFSVADLRRANKLLDQYAPPRRLLVQWVPHGYGFQSMNLPFCLWLWQRANQRHDTVEVMVHEPCLAFGEGSWKQDGVALIHRLMTMILLKAASHVWLSIPAWESFWRPYTLGSSLPFHWLPVAGSIAVNHDPAAVKIVRARYATEGQSILGHFGTYDRSISEKLLQCLPPLLQPGSNRIALLIGLGSEAIRDELLRRHPVLAGLVHATGPLDATDLSVHLSACDLMLQPYVDGVSSRRTSVMAALAHGRPIVTTAGKLTEDLWAESGAVALAPANESDAFERLAKELIEDPDRRAQLGNAAQALYQQRFDLRHTIAALRNGTNRRH